MTSQQSAYPIPGPSYYAQQPPIPPFIYPSAHNASHYQYPYPAPHLPPAPIHHHPPQPTSHRGGRGGYHSPRGGGPTYQGFHPPPQPYIPQPSPSDPYPKYPSPHHHQVAYAPYPLHPNVPYSPVWPAEQNPVSPLPKQLSMPPPVSPVIVPPLAHPQEEPLQPVPVQDIAVPLAAVPPPTVPPPTTVLPPVEPAPENPKPPPSRSVTPSPPRSSPRPLQASFIPSPTISEGAIAARSSSPHVSHPTPAYAVWSRRPQNPSRAPGIIISPRARPPADVVQNALKLPTPPASPKPLSAISVDEPPVKAEEEGPVIHDVEPQHDQVKDRDRSPPQVSSSSATETTACSTAPDTPVPGTPLSSTTSISAAVPSPSQTKSTAVPVPEATRPATDAPVASSSLAVAGVPSSSRTSATVSPSPATAATPPPPKLKPSSWASLFNSDSAGSASSSSKPALPVSSIVGISIPASSQSAGAASSVPSNHLGLSPTQRAELVSLLTTGTPSRPQAPPKIKPRGLVNSGNMCFANSVLQVLVYCPPFWRFFNELGKYLPLSGNAPKPGETGGAEREGGTPFVDATIRFLKEFEVKEKAAEEGRGKGKGKEVVDGDGEDNWLDSFMPTYVYDAMKEKKRFESMRGGQQEDAEEFFGFYLDTLEEELLSLLKTLSPSTSKQISKQSVEERVEEEPSQKDEGWMEVGKKNRTVVTRTIKSTESPITRIFGGKFRSTLCAPSQRDSVLVEDWRSIRLDIQAEHIHSIKDALQYIPHPQSIQMTSPTRPGVTIEASQQVLIDTLPSILVLHLKRFLYDTSVGGVVKLGKPISFTPELEIGPELMAVRKPAPPAKYKLFGVLYHHGLSASGGHYTIDILHPNRDLNLKPREGWIRIDDEFVSDVRPDDVFGDSDRDDRCAYLLLYTRVAAAWGRT